MDPPIADKILVGPPNLLAAGRCGLQRFVRHRERLGPGKSEGDRDGSILSGRRKREVELVPPQRRETHIRHHGPFTIENARAENSSSIVDHIVSGDRCSAFGLDHVQSNVPRLQDVIGKRNEEHDGAVVGAARMPNCDASLAIDSVTRKHVGPDPLVGRCQRHLQFELVDNRAEPRGRRWQDGKRLGLCGRSRSLRRGDMSGFVARLHQCRQE